MKLLTGTNKDVIRRAVILLGDQGVGKTLMAGTADTPLFIDAEARAEHTGMPRIVPDQDEKGWDDLVAIARELKNSPKDPSGLGITFRGVDAKTIVVDTIDRCQELLRIKYADMTNDARKKQQFYGVLLDRMLHDFLFPILALPVNIVIVSHTSEKNIDATDESYNRSLGKNNPDTILPEVGLALEGQLRRRLWNHFDHALHMVRKQTGEIVILTTSQKYEGRFLLAKDKTWLFGGKTLKVEFKENKIVADAMAAIFGSMQTAEQHKAMVSKLRSDIMAYAIEKQVMKDKEDKVGAEIVKTKVMSQITLDIDQMTPETVGDVLAKAKGLLDTARPVTEQTS